MHKKDRFQLSVLSAAIASTLISGYATAQDSILEEVIVTATRRSASLQDIPINIPSLSGKSSSVTALLIWLISPAWCPA